MTGDWGGRVSRSILNIIRTILVAITTYISETGLMRLSSGLIIRGSPSNENQSDGYIFKSELQITILLMQLVSLIFFHTNKKNSKVYFPWHFATPPLR